MDKDELVKCQKAIHELVEHNDFENALPVIYSVLEYHPNDALTLHMLGFIWLQSGKEAFAYQMFRRALQENTKSHQVWTSVGRAAYELGQFKEAINCFVEAVRINPEYVLAYSNMSATLVHLSDWDGAQKAAEMALELDPSDLNARMNLSHCYLAQGHWKAGWEAWGLSLGGKFRKEWTYGDEPRWNGEKGRRLVVYGEQGVGDEMSYASCIPDAISCCEKVFVDCDPKLEGLFRRSFPGAIVHGTRRDDSPDWVQNADINARCAIGGLPEFFRLKTEDFPGTPYLVADPERRLMWKSLFDAWGGKTVGICTRGGIKRTNETGRDIGFNAWLPILHRKGYNFVSLDYKARDTQFFEELHGVKIHKFPFATESSDYDDVAALIAELHCVIGVNTAALHCAGALGVPTIALIPEHMQWRYAIDPMPWYKSMKLWYQKGSWEHTLNALQWD